MPNAPHEHAELTSAQAKAMVAARERKRRKTKRVARRVNAPVQPDCSAAESNYQVRELRDGVWCIYMRQYNVVVAEFSKGCTSAVQEIKAMLDGKTPPERGVASGKD